METRHALDARKVGPRQRRGPTEPSARFLDRRRRVRVIPPLSPSPKQMRYSPLTACLQCPVRAVSDVTADGGNLPVASLPANADHASTHDGPSIGRQRHTRNIIATTTTTIATRRHSPLAAIPRQPGAFRPAAAAAGEYLLGAETRRSVVDRGRRGWRQRRMDEARPGRVPGACDGAE